MKASSKKFNVCKCFARSLLSHLSAAPRFSCFLLTATLLAIPLTKIFYIVARILAWPRRTLATRTWWVAALVTQYNRSAFDPPRRVRKGSIADSCTLATPRRPALETQGPQRQQKAILPQRLQVLLTECFCRLFDFAMRTRESI